MIFALFSITLHKMLTLTITWKIWTSTCDSNNLLGELSLGHFSIMGIVSSGHFGEAMSELAPGQAKTDKVS